MISLSYWLPNKEQRRRTSCSLGVRLHLLESKMEIENIDDIELTQRKIDDAFSLVHDLVRTRLSDLEDREERDFEEEQSLKVALFVISAEPRVTLLDD